MGVFVLILLSYIGSEILEKCANLKSKYSSKKQYIEVEKYISIRKCIFPSSL